MADRDIHVVLCSDHNYFKYGCVTILSLLESNPGVSVVVHYVGSDIPNDDIENLKSLVISHKAQLFYYSVDDSIINKFPDITEMQYLSKMCYCRMLLASILPQSLDKVLYLDTDILVIGPIENLYNEDLEGYYYAAIDDVVSGGNDVYARLGLNKDYTTYFNSGVMLLNLKEWRVDDFEGIIMKLVTNSNHLLIYPDQDILNIVGVGRTKIMPMRYNMQDTCFKVHKPNIKTMVADWNDEISETRIIHFTYFKKPWLFSSTHPCKQMYLSYLKRLGGQKNLNARYSLPHKTHNWRNVGESEQIYEKERYSF